MWNVSCFRWSERINCDRRVVRGDSWNVSAWADELDDLVRAMAGAYIFGIPLLFTMEMWWIGEYLATTEVPTLVGVALAVNFGLTWVGGFKSKSTFRTSLDETIDAVAIGLVAAVVMLVILNQIRPGDSIATSLGKVVIQAVPLSIGAAVTNQVFGIRTRDARKSNPPVDEGLSPFQAVLSDIGATATGGLFLGVSIAPTDEVPMIAAALDYWHLLAIVLFSVLLSYGIVFASGLNRQPSGGVFQRPFTETVLAYIVSLVVAFAALYLFDQISLDDPVRSIAEQVLVLGVPTSVGGAAGRLVI